MILSHGGHLAMSGDIFGWHKWAGGITGFEARNAAKHSAIYVTWSLIHCSCSSLILNATSSLRLSLPVSYTLPLPWSLPLWHFQGSVLAALSGALLDKVCLWHFWFSLFHISSCPLTLPKFYFMLHLGLFSSCSLISVSQPWYYCRFEQSHSLRWGLSCAL